LSWSIEDATQKSLGAGSQVGFRTTAATGLAEAFGVRTHHRNHVALLEEAFY
jgi:hypothetical protein